ncbi:MAG: cysteine desulfurase [Acidimicrobiia bacterium]|nr:cysteine desulfurase [Acidimicrobiia bacterium]
MRYLDHAATTFIRPESRAAMEPFLSERFGNASGIHSAARSVKNAMEEARERAAELLGARRPLEIVFTGGGTEADNLAVAGSALAGDRPRGVITTAVEHEAVLEAGAFVAKLGGSCTIVGVDSTGMVRAEDLLAETDSETAVVSVMAANNEVGTIQPVREIAELMRAEFPEVAVHTDAVQAFVSEDITVQSTGADLISLAAHKFGGPQGVGLLYVRTGHKLEPTIHGGGQEMGRRSGTHNVAGIVGMVAAMEASVADRDAFRKRVGEARDGFEAELSRVVPGLVVNGNTAQRLVQHSHVRFPGISAETLLIRLDQAGICAAAGSACQSGAIDISHVLEAMGFDDVAAGECVRFSFGWVDEASDGAAAAHEVAAVLNAMERVA